MSCDHYSRVATIKGAVFNQVNTVYKQQNITQNHVYFYLHHMKYSYMNLYILVYMDHLQATNWQVRCQKRWMGGHWQVLKTHISMWKIEARSQSNYWFTLVWRHQTVSYIANQSAIILKIAWCFLNTDVGLVLTL